VVTRLAAAQAALGCPVQIAAYGVGESKRRALGLLEQTPGYDRVEVIWLGELSKYERFSASHASSVLTPLISDRIDVVHLHGMWEMLLPVVAGIARGSDTPYVLAPHGMLDPVVFDIRRWKKRIALSTTHRKLVPHASCVHMLNKDEADLARPILGAARTRVIPNGIFESEFANLPPRGAFRQRHPALGDDPMVLFLSRLQYKKGLDYLVDAFEHVLDRVPSSRLVIAGPDGGELGKTQQRVSAAGIQERVHFVGPVYGVEKLEALRDADVFCLPSRQEGFSIAISEAMAIGLPVVVSRACHFPEVSQVNAGIETELDAGEVGDAVVRVLSDPKLAADMGRAGAALIRERFTWERVAARSLEVYAECIGNESQ